MAPRWRFVKESRAAIASGLWDVAEAFQATHDRECAARVLALPDEHAVAMVITFGCPEEASRHRGIARTPVAEPVHHERR
jgi:nitroreductase